MPKRLVLISLLILYLLPYSWAKEKVIEKSGKKPKWISQSSDFYLVSIKCASLNDCGLRAGDVFRTSLTELVAKQLTVSDDHLKKKRLETYLETIKWSTIKDSSFEKITGFHDTLLLDYYWEKKKLKSGGYLYHYRALFNCKPNEIKKIALNFDKFYNATYNALEPFSDKIDATRSLTCLLQIQDTLKKIKIKTHPKFNHEIDLLDDKIANKIKLVKIVIKEKSERKIVFGFILNKSPLSIEKRPLIYSTCAQIKSINCSNTDCSIEFDKDYCLSEDVKSGFTIESGNSNQIFRRHIYFH